MTYYDKISAEKVKVKENRMKPDNFHTLSKIVTTNQLISAIGASYVNL